MDSVRKDDSDYTVCMHLAIDIREACRAKRAGKGQWTYGFVTELLARRIPLTLYTDAPPPPDWQALLAERHDVRVRHLREHGLRWHLAVAREIRTDDTIHAYVATVSYIVPALLKRAKPVVMIVHDLIAFRGEPHDRRATLIERLTLGRAARAAALVCTVSETTKRDLLGRIPSLSAARVEPIFAAPVFPPASAGGEQRHILCIATLCPRKNQLRLIRAHASLPSSLRAAYPLVLVGGRGWQDDEIVALAAATDHVEWKAYLPDDACGRLMEQAVCFAYPSLYEGFGMPIIEAMAAGIPVLTADRGSMREVAGDAALLINPENVASIREGMNALLTDATLRHRLATAGRERAGAFSWRRTVDLFLGALSRIDKKAQ